MLSQLYMYTNENDLETELSQTKYLERVKYPSATVIHVP